MNRLLLSSAISFAVACGGGDSPVGGDAHVDAPIDTGSPADAFCGAKTLFTGEYVDWDSSAARFLGIFDAAFSVEGGSGAHASEHTPPNGRFILCLDAAANGTLVDIAPGSDSDMGSGGAYLPGVAIAEKAVIAAIPFSSARSFTEARRATMFTQIGTAYDPAKGQLFVHLTNTTATLAISATHDMTQAFGASETWAAGTTGTYVFFPNVNLSGGPTVTLTGTPAVSGGGAFPVAAGKLTYLEVTGP